MVSLAKSKRDKSEWILFDHLSEMLTYWRTPKAKEKSEKACASRLFNCNGLGAHRHITSSNSYAKVQDVLVVFQFH
ncbi:unnamed protein product [Arabis nemorensis]|uniref:Uncharacterized protein n=1 Tax=Arabis nemorensis TaxID=586526 RepID=A0A565C6F2_9BRAS|nr:unnamed protein product [Arabis nemorensis]